MKKGHESEGELEYIYGKVWVEEKEGRNIGTKL